MDLSALREAGLTEGEVKVYLALLEIGSSTSGPIIERSGVARSIIYQILDKLVQKGLVSYIIKEKTKYFQSAEPSKLKEYLDEKERQFENNKKKIEELLPDLMARQNGAKKSEVNLYLGFKGIQTAHQHLYLKLKKGEEYQYLGVPAFQPEVMHLFWERDHVRRVKAGIKFRALFNKDVDFKIVENRNSYKGADVRIMNSEIKTPATFAIFADTVLIVLQHPEAIAVEIINKSIADSFKAYFEEFWRRSKPFNKNE